MAADRKPAGSSSVAWAGTTLEWATSSPPVTGNFPAPPIVTSATPLADGELAYDGLVEEDDADRDETTEGEES